MATAMDKDNSVTACGFCLCGADEMVDPRALPCGHTFCTPCIEGHYNPNTAETQCRTCR